MTGDMLTERYVAIDVAVRSLSPMHAMHIAVRRSMHDEVAAFISLVFEVGLRPPATQRVWTFELGDASAKARQIGYISPTFSLNADGEPSVPDDGSELNVAVRGVWALAQRLSERDRQRFVRSLDALRTGTLLRVDLGLRLAAAAHSAIAVEALTGKQSEKEFTQFLVRFAGPSLPQDLRDRLPAQSKDYYHSVRSTYAHGRENYIEENDPFERLEKLASGSRALDEISFPKIVGHALLAWLVDRATGKQ